MRKLQIGALYGEANCSAHDSSENIPTFERNSRGIVYKTITKSATTPTLIALIIWTNIGQYEWTCLIAGVVAWASRLQRIQAQLTYEAEYVTAVELSRCFGCTNC